MTAPYSATPYVEGFGNHDVHGPGEFYPAHSEGDPSGTGNVLWYLYRPHDPADVVWLRDSNGAVFRATRKAQPDGR